MDTKDWNAWTQLFTADAVMDMRVLASEPKSDGADEESAVPAAGSTQSGVYVGTVAIRKYVSEALDPATPVHHAHTPEIELTGRGSARGIWAMEFFTRWPEGFPLSSIHGFGHYHDTYCLVSGQWLIESTRLETIVVNAV